MNCSVLLMLLSSQTPLTADEAVRLALSRDPAAAVTAVQAEQERVDVGEILHSPELRLEHRSADQWFFGTRTDKGQYYGPWDDLSAALAWDPPVLEDFWPRPLAAARMAKAVKIEGDERSRTLAADVRLLHARLLLLREEALVQANTVQVAERIRDVVRSLREASAATDADLGVAELDVLDARADLDEVAGSVAAAQARLAALTGLATPLQIAGEAPPCGASISLEEAVARAESNSPRLRALIERDRSLDAEGVGKALRYVPWVQSMQVAYINQPVDNRDDIRLRVDVSLPIFALLDGEGEILRLKRAEVAAKREDEKAALRVDVLDAMEREADAHALVDRYAAATTVASAGEKSSLLALESGHATAATVAELQKRTLRARRGHLRARERCAEASIERMRLLGDDPALANQDRID